MNVNNINRLRRTLHNHVYRKSQKGKKNTDFYKPRLIAEEKSVQDMSACLKEFQCDPFDLSDTTLRSLQSELCATDELLADVVSTKRDGENMVRSFIDERVFSIAKSLNGRIPRSNKLNFENEVNFRIKIKINLKVENFLRKNYSPTAPPQPDCS